MKVRELIERLRCEDQDTEVMIAYDYGDHSHTTVAEDIGHIEELPIQYSEYFRRHTVTTDDEDEDEGDIVTAIILSRH